MDINGFFDPKTQGLLGLSAGLLAAGGPSPRPVGLGTALSQGLLGGMQGYQQGVNTQRNEVMYKLQIEKLAREKRQQDALAALYGPQASQPQQAPQGETPAGMSPSTSMSMFGTAEFATPEQPKPQGLLQQRGPSLEQLGAAAASGVKIDDFLKLWELQRDQASPKMEVSGGYAYNPRAIQPGTFLPRREITPQGQGVGISATGEVSPLPGSLSTYTQFQDATEASKARRDPFMGVTDSQGRAIPMTRESFSQVYGGVGQPGQQPQAGSVENSTIPPSDVMGFAPTEADALARVRKAIQQGQTARITVDPSKAGGMGQTPAERTTSTAMAEGDVKRVQDLETKIPSYLSVQRRLDRMEALTKDDRTYAASGAELKSLLGSVAQAFGLPVAQEKTANTENYLANVAELLKDRLASKDYGSGSGVSNLDLIAAKGPLPELAKTAQGRIQIIQALRADTERSLRDAQAARDHFDTNGSLRGFRYPSELEAQNRRFRETAQDGPQPSPVRSTLKYNPATGRIE